MSIGKNISFIGSGNLSWHLAPALDNAGHAVREVYSRNKKNAKELVNRLYQAEVKEDLDFSDSISQIFIIAISDDAIAEVSQELVLPDNAVVVHTSGAKSLEVLGYTAADAIGVFYPLQTFSKSKSVNFEYIPICIESENADVEKMLMSVAKDISKKVYRINSQDRKALHVAAVFASNFTNHCLAIAENILSENEIDFNILKPLILETIEKGLAIGPSNAQTGPAKRHDFETLDEHMSYLEKDESLTEIYKIFSQNIIDNNPID